MVVRHAQAHRRFQAIGDAIAGIPEDGPFLRFIRQPFEKADIAGQLAATIECLGGPSGEQCGDQRVDIVDFGLIVPLGAILEKEADNPGEAGIPRIARSQAQFFGPVLLPRDRVAAFVKIDAGDIGHCPSGKGAHRKRRIVLGPLARRS
jgi:hypothetical protein